MERSTSSARKTFLWVAFIAIVCSLVLLVAQNAMAERRLGLSSLSFQFSTTAGNTSEGTIYVSNEGDEDINVLVYAADQVFVEDGEIEYVVPGRDQIDFTNPASWISVKMPTDSRAVGNTPYIVLAPDEQVPVDFEISVPQSAPPGDSNIVLFFEMFVIDDNSAGNISTVSGRIGSRITMRVQGVIRESIDISPFWAPTLVTNNAIPYSFTPRNRGNIDKVINVDLALLDRSKTEVVADRVIEEVTLFATENKETSGEIQPTKALIGPHTIQLELTYVPLESDVEVRVVEERTVWMVPLWLAITIGVIVVFFILLIVWRLGRGSGRRRETRGGGRRVSGSGDDARREARMRRIEEREQELGLAPHESIDKLEE